MDNDSIFGHHCITVYIESVGTHFHYYCTKIILHNADSISAVVTRKTFPIVNMLLVHKKFQTQSIKSIFLLPGFHVLQIYHYYYYVLFMKILRNYIFQVNFVGYNLKVSHLRHITNIFLTSNIS